MTRRRQPADDGSLLSALGFSEQEERVYARLLAAPNATIADLARASGFPKSQVPDLLASLEAKGCVSRLPGKTVRYVGAPPDLAIGALILRHEERLERARLHSLKLLEHMRGGSAAGAPPAEVLELVEGNEGIHQRYVQLQEMAKSEVLSFDRPPYIMVDNPAVAAALKRGISYRTVYSREALDHPGKLERIRIDISGGEDARVAEEVPIKMAISDGRMAVIPHRTGEHNSPVSLLVHSSSLLESFVTLFELVWDRATPLRLSADSVEVDEAGDGSPEETDVLSLMAVGLKDETIARNLGISSRTVSRRINQVMEELGAATRFQAGVEATLRGWVQRRS